jgi:hypothetical protein
VLPIRWFVYFKSLHCSDVDHVHKSSDFVYQTHRTQPSQLFGKSLGEDDEIVSADWSQVDYEGVLVVVDCILFVVTYQLFGVFFSTNHILTNELHQTLSMGSMLKQEIQSVSSLLLFDPCAFLSCIVLQNKLLKV